MSRGNRLPGGGQDSFIVKFSLPAQGDQTKDALVTAETSLTVDYFYAVTAAFNESHWVAPWPCRVAEVFAIGQFAASGDQMYVRVARGTPSAYTADAVISNAVAAVDSSNPATSTDYMTVTGTATNGFASTRYTGAVQYTGGEVVTATGFVDAEEVFDAGDRLTASYEMAVDGDAASQVYVMVTMNRID